MIRRDTPGNASESAAEKLTKRKREVVGGIAEVGPQARQRARVVGQQGQGRSSPAEADEEHSQTCTPTWEGRQPRFVGFIRLGCSYGITSLFILLSSLGADEPTAEPLESPTSLPIAEVVGSLRTAPARHCYISS